MAKKRPDKPRNYLIIAVLTSILAILPINHFTLNNGYNLLNTLSTSATMFGISLLPVILLFAFVFWLKMLVDAAQQGRWVWLIFIVLGDLLFAVLYLLIKKPKLTLASFKPTAWVALALFVIMWGLQIYPNLRYNGQLVEVGELKPTGRQFEAEVITKDLNGFMYEGNTTCREMKSNGVYYLEVTGGKILIPQDSPSVHVNYRLSTDSNDSNAELGGGWQSSEQPILSKQEISIDDLIGGPHEISHDITGCRVDLWTSN